MGPLVTAGLTAVLGLVAVGFLARRFAGHAATGWALPLAVLAALPLQPLVYFLVRIPIQLGITGLLPSGLLPWVGFLYAPLTEEPAKWLVALWLRRAIRPDSWLGIALGIGLGFALGEIALIAFGLSLSPASAATPFWAYWGFAIERLATCLLHGLMLGPVLRPAAQGRALWPGALTGVALHFAINFPILFVQIDLFGLGRPVWQILVLGWVLSLTAVLFAILSKLAVRDARGIDKPDAA
jgi:hypothetical protein